MVVSPTAPNKIFAGTGKKIDRAYGAGVYISNNSGDTWQASNEGFPVASDSVAKFDSTGIYPEVYAFDSSSTSPSSIFTVAGGTVYKLN